MMHLSCRQQLAARPHATGCPRAGGPNAAAAGGARRAQRATAARVAQLDQLEVPAIGGGDGEDSAHCGTEGGRPAAACMPP
jgi:hypothetical protein